MPRIQLQVDGRSHTPDIDVRTTLLDALRERCGVTSAKKGCDHGQCGACTVLLDGERRLTCLSLAIAHDGAEITTASGLAEGEGKDLALHPMQQAFADLDALQCGYCTPGQVCSAIGMLEELAAGQPSHVTEDLTASPSLSPAEIRERMSGNLCRCGAHVAIVAAIEQAGQAQTAGAS